MFLAGSLELGSQGTWGGRGASVGYWPVREASAKRGSKGSPFLNGTPRPRPDQPPRRLGRDTNSPRCNPDTSRRPWGLRSCIPPNPAANQRPRIRCPEQAQDAGQRGGQTSRQTADGRLTDRRCAWGKPARNVGMMQASRRRPWDDEAWPATPYCCTQPKPRQNKLTAGMRPWCGLRSGLPPLTLERRAHEGGVDKQLTTAEDADGGTQVFLSAHSGEAFFRCRRAQDPNPRYHAGQGSEKEGVGLEEGGEGQGGWSPQWCNGRHSHFPSWASQFGSRPCAAARARIEAPPCA